jgi:hypothetical protein
MRYAYSNDEVHEFIMRIMNQFINQYLVVILYCIFDRIE